MTVRTTFSCGKIILSGEYAVVFGYPGLAVPSTIGLTAIHEGTNEPLTIGWPGITSQWKSYIDGIVVACERIAGRSFSGNLSIKCDLPLGKGMGSSTTCVIAIAKALLGDDCEAAARAMEDEVNPGNSGLDFAVIWNNRPIKFIKGQPSETVALPKDILRGAILIDTGAPQETTPKLITWVKSHEAELQSSFKTIGQCTDRLLAGESPLTVFPNHHRAQMTLGVVPKVAADLIASIEASGGAAKVIGAGGRTGGGGMVLAVHPEKERLEELAKDLPVIGV